jgi:hypothetical protein
MRELFSCPMLQRRSSIWIEHAATVALSKVSLLQLRQPQKSPVRAALTVATRLQNRSAVRLLLTYRVLGIKLTRETLRGIKGTPRSARQALVGKSMTFSRLRWQKEASPRRSVSL